MAGLSKEEIAELWAQKQPPVAEDVALSELIARAHAAESVLPRLNRHERRKAKAAQ